MNINMFAQEGWVCPLCGRVNAPWMPCCSCTDKEAYYSATTGTSNDEKDKQHHNTFYVPVDTEYEPK